MKKLLLLLMLLVHLCVTGQQSTIHIFGMLSNGKKAPLKRAEITNILSATVFKVDSTATAKIPVFTHGTKLLIAAVNYTNDTLEIDSLKNEYFIMLFPTKELKEVEITFRNYDTKIDLVKTIKVETIGQNELKKAACCNLAESFESNASVDVVYTDAVTGARTIQMLGLSGLYSPIQIENVPYTRGLASNFGLTYIPGTWLQGIQITKGVGSVVNGFESMGGMINIELLKPEDKKTENIFVNIYGSSMGRAEANVHLNKKFKNNWSTLLFLHGNSNFTENDLNADGFRDNPLSKQVNVMNRWKHKGKKTEQVIMLHTLTDDKMGGQLGATRSVTDQQLYGANVNTQMHQVYFKNGFLFPKKTLASLGLIASYRYIKNQSNFGLRLFDAHQQSGYFNSIYSNYIGNTFHTIKAGTSFIYDQTTYALSGISVNQQEYIPGAFFEYNYSPGNVFSLLIGNRLDYHSQFGLQYTPRIHLKYLVNENISLRALAGTGFRTSKTIMENISALASSRIILIQPNLLPEKAFNTGISYSQEINVGKNKWMFNMDYYYTRFLNQVVVDYDVNVRELNIYNLTGESFAHSFQADLDMMLSKTLQVKIAYKYYDVKQTVNNLLQQKAMVAPNRIMGNVSYRTENKKWKFDLITNWIDAPRIPTTKANPVDYQFTSKGEQLYIVHFQVTKLFRKFETYAGVENLLNQTQRNAILDSKNPFGTYFDASMIWGPLNGRVIYAGIRYSLIK